MHPATSPGHIEIIQPLQALHPNILFTKTHYFQKCLPLAFLFLLAAPATQGQTSSKNIGKIAVTVTKAKKPKQLYIRVNILSAFPGGDSAWIQSLENNLKLALPYRNGARKGVYTTTIAFILDKGGVISDIRCLSDPGYGIGEQVIRTLKKSPRWTPAPPGGIPVRVIDARRE